jgi:hypothetical protein
MAFTYEHDIVYTDGGFAPADLETLAAGARVYAIRAE